MKSRFLLLVFLGFLGLALEGRTADLHTSVLGTAQKDLVKAGGEATTAEAIKSKKYLFLYFSAHWCPPCRVFTPLLVDFYNQQNATGDFEVLFVSGDHSPKEAIDYMKSAKMPWAGIKLNSVQTDLLKEKYSVQGIPYLVLLDENDEIVATSGYDSGGYNAGKPLEVFALLHKK